MGRLYMLKIAVVDDEKLFLRKFTEKLKSFIDINNSQIDMFSSPVLFIRCWDFRPSSIRRSSPSPDPWAGAPTAWRSSPTAARSSARPMRQWRKIQNMYRLISDKKFPALNGVLLWGSISGSGIFLFCYNDLLIAAPKIRPSELFMQFLQTVLWRVNPLTALSRTADTCSSAALRPALPSRGEDRRQQPAAIRSDRFPF